LFTLMVNLGYLGPQGSHSHGAIKGLVEALGHCSDSLPVFRATPYPSLEVLMQAIAKGETPLGVLPIENLLEGAVVDVLETIGLQRLPLAPLAEWQHHIQHALIAPAGVSLGNIRKVLSHPQALGQCRHTLQNLLQQGYFSIPTASTAQAVSQLNETQYATQSAALGTPEAASLHGLHVLETNVGDSPDNTTRFLLVCSVNQHAYWQDYLNNTLSSTTKAVYKTSFGFSVENKPGALVDTLQFFKSFRLNLVRIESRPSRRKLGEYWFFVDVLANATGSNYDVLWEQLQQSCQVVHRLGPYWSL
jgi:prephenate dehydratase